MERTHAVIKTSKPGTLGKRNPIKVQVSLRGEGRQEVFVGDFFNTIDAICEAQVEHAWARYFKAVAL